MADIEPYVKVSRQVAQDTRLSFEARGVMLYLMSKPEGWKILPADLRREGGIGRDKVYSILAELETAGYLKPRVQARKPDGTFGWSDYELQPCTENTGVVEPHKKAKSPRTPSPRPAEPYTAEPYTVNTDVLDIKEEQIKEKKKNPRTPPAARSDHGRLMFLYQEVLPDKRIPNGGREAKAAKEILAAGYTPEQAIQVYQHLKQDPFYGRQHLSLQTVNTHIAATLQAIKNGSQTNGRRNTSIRQNPGGAFERANWTFEGADDGAVPDGTRNGAAVPGVRKPDRTS